MRAALGAIQKSRVFKFLSSVKLAIPLMCVICISVAYGTVVESLYNTDLARMKVYRTNWFEALVALLFINILFAALSRLPFKKRHLGFVITHIGMLTLLIGSTVTNYFGIDGQLRVVQGSASDEVYLSDLIVEIEETESHSISNAPIDRGVRELSINDLKNVNKRLSSPLSVTKYLPFTEMRKGFESGGDGDRPAVSVRLKSAFFDVTEWLDSDVSEKQMGPAKLKLVVHDGTKEPILKLPKSKAAADSYLSISDGSKEFKTGIPDLKSKGVSIGEVKITLIKQYEQAQVGGKGKIQEGGEPGANPALELLVTRNEESQREVVYSRFPDFSLHKNGIFGLKFKFEAGAGQTVAKNEMPDDAVHAGMANRTPSGGPEMQFHLFKDKTEVRLLKGGQEVLSKTLSPGESLITPWMGIELFLNETLWQARIVDDVRPVELKQRTELPPAAIFLSSGDDDGFWLTEGETKTVVVGEKSYQAYFGRQMMKLPFKIHLQKFSKVDYPGTETPMSYESEVTVKGLGRSVISMNEPLVESGFTVYQSSYVLEPGQTPVSIFSVNADPGRPIKYLGSLILVIGIVTFAISRSRLNKGVPA